MIKIPFTFLQKLLFLMGPERAQRLVLSNIDRWMNLGFLNPYIRDPMEDPIELMGLKFPNTIGLAAGFDRAGKCVSGFGGLGFGHIEVGSVWEQSTQSIKSISLRAASQTVAYTEGMGGAQVDQVLENLKSAAAYRNRVAILGVNIAGEIGEDAKKTAQAFIAPLNKVYRHTDYVTLNLTSGLSRGFATQYKGQVALTLKQVAEERERLMQKEGYPYRPIAVKVAAGQDNDTLLWLTDQLLYYRFDGIVATGSGVGIAGERLSGSVIKDRSTEVIELLATHLRGDLPIIASGGVLTPEDALEKIKAGANLVQIFSGLIFNGPGLVADASDLVARWRLTQKGVMKSLRPSKKLN